MLGRLIPLLPILFLLGGFFTGHTAPLTAVIVLFSTSSSDLRRALAADPALVAGEPRRQRP